MLRPGGTLVTFSCFRAGLSPDLFRRSSSAHRWMLGRTMQVIERLSQGSDHPLLLSFLKVNTPQGVDLQGVVTI